MKKKISQILLVFYLVLNYSIIQAQAVQVVITELFILTDENSHVPQYIELYNNSDTTVNLSEWTLTTINNNNLDTAKIYFKGLGTQSTSIINNLNIDPYGYFLIETSFCHTIEFLGTGCGFNNGIYDDNIDPIYKQGDIDGVYLYLPLTGKGTIVLEDNSDPPNEIDRVTYDKDDIGWAPLLSESSRGHSIYFHGLPDTLANNLSSNWFLSPITEKSSWLYDDDGEIRNYGSPREENAFKLNDIFCTNCGFPDKNYPDRGTHRLYGDKNDYYRAEPFIDFGIDREPDTGDYGENNGIYDIGEDYDDRDLNGVWNYQNNNYKKPLSFSWKGTFIDTTVVDSPAINYIIIIEKKVKESHGLEVNNLNWENISNTLWLNILDTTISILPSELLISELGIGRELVEYMWTIQLTKTYTNYIDTIYSDKYSFFIDAYDYGRYGCVDDGCCTSDPNAVEEDGCPRLCPGSASVNSLPSLYNSKHPHGCTIGENCYSAINYYENANINSNTCHYIALTVPKFSLGSPTETIAVPIYLQNDSLADINSIQYTLLFDNNNSNIISYKSITFDGTILSDVITNNNDISLDINPENISLSIDPTVSFDKEGIITYVNFNVDAAVGSQTDFTLNNFPVISGGDVENNINIVVNVPIVNNNGDIVIIKENNQNYKIDGNVIYYAGSSFIEVPNVIVTLDQKYNGLISPEPSIINTNDGGRFDYYIPTIGNFSLSFSKNSFECNRDDYLTGHDIFDLAQYVSGKKNINSSKLLAADVSLDGSVTGLDVSLLAQYYVDLRNNFNDLETHWSFESINKSNFNTYSTLIEKQGQVKIDYEPLLFDDINRDVYAYRLGDVAEPFYCEESLNRYDNNKINYQTILTEYESTLIIEVIVNEPTLLEMLNFEIGYQENVFKPIEYTFEAAPDLLNNYKLVSNLFSNNGTIKAIIWAEDDPQLISGLIGTIRFNWNNIKDEGKIWLENVVVNNEYSGINIKISNMLENKSANGLNIINQLAPTKIALEQNYPNPFNPQTSIVWSMNKSDNVSIKIFNLKGQLVHTLFTGFKESGIHAVNWDASEFSSGIYYYRLIINNIVINKKMILLR